MEVRYLSPLSIEAMTIKANITNDSCQTDRFIDVGIELTPVTVPLVRLVCGQASLLIGIIAIFPLVCRDESIHMDEFENPCLCIQPAREPAGCNNCDARFVVELERAA